MYILELRWKRTARLLARIPFFFNVSSLALLHYLFRAHAWLLLSVCSLWKCRSCCLYLTYTRSSRQDAFASSFILLPSFISSLPTWNEESKRESVKEMGERRGAHHSASSTLECDNFHDRTRITCTNMAALLRCPCKYFNPKCVIQPSIHVQTNFNFYFWFWKLLKTKKIEFQRKKV